MKWKRQRFDQLADFRNGLNFGADQRGGELAVLGVGDFGQSVLRSSDSLETVSVSNGSSGVSELAEGDLVFVRSNGSRDLVGRCMYVERVTRRTSHSGFTIRARATSDDLNPKWAATFFQSGMADRAMGRGSPGTNISNITQGILGGVEIPIPPKAVQDHLVRVLDGVDQRRDKLEALLKAKRAFKGALMIDLLTGRRRFPEFEGPPWIRRPLGDFLREKLLRNSGGRVQLVYSCSKLYGIIPQADRFKHRVAARIVDNYKVVSQGDLVYDPMLLWDASLGFVPNGADGVVSPAYTTLTLVGSEVHRGFLAHALFSHRARHLYKTVSRGTNVRRKKVLASDFLRITLPVPPTLAEQRRVAELLDLCEAEIRHLAEQAAQLATLKRGLMHRFLLGKIELPEHLTTVSAAAEATDDDS